MEYTVHKTEYLDEQGLKDLWEKIKAYVAENAPTQDLSSYATKEYVIEAINAIPDVDLSSYITSEALAEQLLNYAEKNHTHSEYLTEHQDISGLATKEEVATKADIGHKHVIADITDYTEPDLSNYATKNEIPSLEGYATQEYVTEQITNASLGGEVDLSEYAKKTDIHSHTNKNVLDDISATDVSNWNDAKVHSSQPHAPSTAQPNFIEDIKVNGASLMINDKTVNIDLSKYAKKTDIPDVSNFITSIPEEYITEEELNAKGYLTEHQDLSSYALKTDIPDTSNFLTSIPEEYVTDTELNAKGYLTKHQDLSNYYNKEEVSSLIDEKLGVIENGTY